MLKLFMTCLLFFSYFNLEASYSHSSIWDSSYQKVVIKKIGEKLPELVNYPFLQYPNEKHELILAKFPNGKVPIFGYGSLMNKFSAGRSVKPEAVDSMSPVLAFGVKRVFNYNPTKTDHWGELQPKEKSMLNLVPSLNLTSMINGIVMEVDEEDFSNLVMREKGYDLIPILVVSWEDTLNQEQNIKVQVAYTFVAANELRGNVVYTSTEYYPLRSYMHAVQQGALEYGEKFYHLWNKTTYLADGTTSVENWDELTFKGILCTQKP